MTLRPWRNWLLGTLFVALGAVIAWGQARKEDSARLPLVYSNSGSWWEISNSSILSKLRKRRSCAGKIEVNRIQEKADYTFRLEGKSLKWTWDIARRDGSILASGSAFGGNHAIDDACAAIAKDWQERKPDSEKQGPARDSDSAPNGRLD